MTSLLSSVFIILVLLVYTKTKASQLRPTIHREKKPKPVGAGLNLVAKEAVRLYVAGSTQKKNTQNEQPSRLNPGRSDPHRHFIHGQHP